ncbi:MAG: carbohydrate ABC transporter permease [Subdoligranulum sp.]|nr:carbohydrate ABC transporter permease [Subdoligranulum sp.]
MHIKETSADRIFKAIAVLFVTLFALACLYPLVMVLSVSFSNETQVLLNGYSVLPQSPTLDTYRYIFVNSGTKILNSYGVTIFITVVGTLSALLITSMCAFSLSNPKMRYRNVIAWLCNFTIVFSAGLVPSYIICTSVLHLKNTIWAMIVPSMFSVWNMFLMRTYFSQVPYSLYESALIEGAGWFRIFWRIAVPLSKTALLTVGLMYALTYWNDWWNALMYVEKKDLFPLQYFLYGILSNVNAISSGRVPAGASGAIQLPAETVKMAVTIITIGPVIFLYPFIQKYFVSGVMSGAVKE